METVISYFRDLQIDILSLLKTGGILILGMLVISLLGRFVFGFLDYTTNAPIRQSCSC